ncbi:unnamed protein product [Larinioides sclopetarius]|uniref:Cytochrome P450 n=2 Tax=Larinioides sclopetarius TaxID=280406 RepID=A0AAV1ZJV1_9ARAC
MCGFGLHWKQVLIMYFSLIFENMLQLSSVQIIWNIFALFLISVTIRISIFVLNYAIGWRKISKTIPATKMRFFNLLGTVSEIPFSKKSRNGQSVLVYLQQLVLAYRKLLEQEKLYCLWLFFLPLIILPNAEAVEEVFSGMKTIEKPFFIRWTSLFLGNGLLTSSGHKWKSQRKMLNPCFRTYILKEHLQTINKHSQILAKRLMEETEKEFTKISKYLSDCTFDIICEAIYGLDLGTQETHKERVPFVYAINKGFSLMTRRFLNVFLWTDLFFNFSKTGREIKEHSQVARDFTRNLIDKEKQNFLKLPEHSEKERKSLVKLLLKEYYLSKEISEEDIRDQLMTFTIAGQDTTKIALSWILYMLGLHAEIRGKVYEELDLIFGVDHERHATAEDLKNMKYLECVIKETLRIYPPVPILTRYLKEDTTICGYQIPKGTICAVFPHVLHRDEKVFPNPEKFEPDRFLPENSANRHPYAWIPFSAGPRNCIGQKLAFMELVTITSTILRRYTVESLDPRDQVLPTLTIALSSSIPLRIKIRPRHTKDI